MTVLAGKGRTGVAVGGIGAVTGVVARLHAANPDNARSKASRRVVFI
jgi:hypothetical protein